MDQIRGIVYGKCTTVLRKNYNKKLESWLCFSIIIDKRSLDFHCQPEQINPWFIALSVMVK